MSDPSATPDVRSSTTTPPDGCGLASSGPTDPRLADVRAQLDRAADLLSWGAPALGILRGFGPLADRLMIGQSRLPLAAILDGLSVAGCWTLAGLTAGALLRGLGGWLLFRSIQRPIAPVVAVQPAMASASAPPPEVARPSESLESLREQAWAEARLLIRGGQWAEAREKIDALVADRADPVRVAGLDREFQTARETARNQHLAGLEAARTVNDPDRVLELHQILVPLLEEEARRELEADLSAWFLRLIHNRLRTGRIQSELAQLASRIAEAFSHTTEGASLRASLPMLRRSAGLCPRCAQPYTGLGDACPACLARAQTPVAPAPDPDPEPDFESSGGDSWLNASV